MDKKFRIKKPIAILVCLLSPFLITTIDFYLIIIFDPDGHPYFTLLVWFISSLIPVYLNTYMKNMKWRVLYSVFIVPIYIFLMFWLFEILALAHGDVNDVM